MQDYKQDVIDTRKNCLGGSDAKLIMQVATMGYVPKSAYKRLAVCKGYIEPQSITTRVMQYGDFIEQQIFEHISHEDNRYQSNPCLVSDTYSRKNVKMIDHVDFLLQDEEKRTLYMFECKASRYTTEQVRQIYKAQLYHHFVMGREYAARLFKEGKGQYKVKVVLCHYDTSSVDIDAPFEFDPSKITLKEVRFVGALYDVNLGMDIINTFLETFDFYSEDDEINSEYLPEKVKKEFESVSSLLAEIKQREKQVNEFKKKVLDFFIKKGIKKVSCDKFSFTLVAESTTSTVDYKTMFEDEIASKHPTKARKLERKYSKESKRSAYVVIKTKENTNN